MTVYYLDSSAWVKHFVYEPGSAWVSRLFEQQEIRKLAPEAVDQAIATLQTNWRPFCLRSF